MLKIVGIIFTIGIVTADIDDSDSVLPGRCSVVSINSKAMATKCRNELTNVIKELEDKLKANNQLKDGLEQAENRRNSEIAKANNDMKNEIRTKKNEILAIVQKVKGMIANIESEMDGSKKKIISYKQAYNEKLEELERLTQTKISESKTKYEKTVQQLSASVDETTAIALKNKQNELKVFKDKCNAEYMIERKNALKCKKQFGTKLWDWDTNGWEIQYGCVETNAYEDPPLCKKLLNSGECKCDKEECKGLPRILKKPFATEAYNKLGRVADQAATFECFSDLNDGWAWKWGDKTYCISENTEC